MAIINSTKDWYYYDYYNSNYMTDDRYYVDKDYINVGYKTYIKNWYTFKTPIEHLIERIREIGIVIENTDIYTANDYVKLAEELDKLKLNLWAKPWKNGQYKNPGDNKRNELENNLLEDELFEI